MSTSACGEGGPNGAVGGLDDTSVPGARAKLNNVLHVRDLSEKIALERRNSRPGPTQRRLLRDGANGRPWRAVQWLIGVAIERDEACAIANHSLEPALANSAPAHLLQSFWLLSEHWACAAELSKPVFFNTTFCE